MVCAIANLTSPLRRVNSALQRGTNITISDTCAKWSVMLGMVTYTFHTSGRHLLLTYTSFCPELTGADRSSKAEVYSQQIGRSLEVWDAWYLVDSMRLIGILASVSDGRCFSDTKGRTEIH